MAPPQELSANVNFGPVVLALLGVAAVVAYLILFFSAQAGLLALAAAWLAVGAWRFPKAAFALLLFFAPLLPIIKATEVLGPLTLLKDVIIGALFLRTAVLPVLHKRDPYRRNPLLLPIAVFVLWSFVGLAQTDAFVLGALRLRDLLLYLPLLWIARFLVRTHEDVRDLLRVLAGSAALVLLLALAQFLFFADGMVLRFDPARDTWIPRAGSVLAHPSILGSYLLFVIPLWSSLLFVRSLSLGSRLLSAALSAGGFVALIATYSRGAWLAAAVSLCALAITAVPWRRGALLAVAVGTIGVVALPVLLLPNVRSLLHTVADPTYQSNRERLDILAGLVAASTHVSALTGQGLADVLGATGRTATISLGDIVAADASLVRAVKAKTFVDNAVLKTWIELGLVGVLLLALIAGRFLVMCFRNARGGGVPEARAFARAGGAVTVGLIVLSFFLDVPEVFPVALLWWTYVGTIEALPYLTNAEEKDA